MPDSARSRLHLSALALTLVFCGKPSEPPPPAVEPTVRTNASTPGPPRARPLVPRPAVVTLSAPSPPSPPDPRAAPSCIKPTTIVIALTLSDLLKSRILDVDALNSEVLLMSSALNEVLFPGKTDPMSAVIPLFSVESLKSGDTCLDIITTSGADPKKKEIVPIPITGFELKSSKEGGPMQLTLGTVSTKCHADLPTKQAKGEAPTEDDIETVAACAVIVTLRQELASGASKASMPRYLPLLGLEDPALISALRGIKHRRLASARTRAAEVAERRPRDATEVRKGLAEGRLDLTDGSASRTTEAELATRHLLMAQVEGNEWTAGTLFEALMRSPALEKALEKAVQRAAPIKSENRLKREDVDRALKSMSSLLESDVFNRSEARVFTARAYEVLTGLSKASEQAAPFAKAMEIWESLRERSDPRIKVLAEQRMVALSLLMKDFGGALAAQHRLQQLTPVMNPTEAAETQLQGAHLYLALEQWAAHEQRLAPDFRGVTLLIKERLNPLRDVFARLDQKAADVIEVQALDPLGPCEQQVKSGRSCAEDPALRDQVARYLGKAQAYSAAQADAALGRGDPALLSSLGSVRTSGATAADPALAVYALRLGRLCQHGTALSAEQKKQIDEAIGRTRGEDREQLVELRAACALAAVTGPTAAALRGDWTASDEELLVRWAVKPPDATQALTEEMQLHKLGDAQLRPVLPIVALLRYAWLLPVISAYADWLGASDAQFAKRTYEQCRQLPQKSSLRHRGYSRDEWRDKLLGFWDAMVKPERARAALYATGSTVMALATHGTARTQPHQLRRQVDGMYRCKEVAISGGSAGIDSQCDERSAFAGYQGWIDKTMDDSWEGMFGLQSHCLEALVKVEGARTAMARRSTEIQMKLFQPLMDWVHDIARSSPAPDLATSAFAAYLRIVGDYVSGGKMNPEEFRRTLQRSEVSRVLHLSLSAYAAASHQAQEHLRAATAPELTPDWFKAQEQAGGIDFHRDVPQGHALVRSLSDARAALKNFSLAETSACAGDQERWLSRFLRHAVVVRDPYVLKATDYYDRNLPAARSLGRAYTDWCNAGGRASSAVLALARRIQEGDRGWSALFEDETRFLRFVHRYGEAKTPRAYFSRRAQDFFVVGY